MESDKEYAAALRNATPAAVWQTYVGGQTPHDFMELSETTPGDAVWQYVEGSPMCRDLSPTTRAILRGKLITYIHNNEEQP